MFGMLNFKNHEFCSNCQCLLQDYMVFIVLCMLINSGAISIQKDII